MSTTYNDEWPVEYSNEPPRYLPPIREQKPLTSEELVELATSPKSGLAGRLEAIERDRFQQKMSEDVEVAKQRLLLHEFRSQVSDSGPSDQVEEFVNPTSTAEPRTAPGSRGEADTAGLRPADLAWLALVAQRDPASVTPAEARHLAVLTASAQACAAADPGASDAFLAESVLAPVKRRFDIAEVEHELNQLDAADDYLGESVELAKVLGDAIRKETPALSDSEAYLRGLAMLDRAKEERDETHDRRLAELRAKLALLRKV